MPKSVDEARIFEATAALFVAQGYAGTTTKQIATAAGVNEATLFRRYGSKAKLVAAAIDQQWKDLPLGDVSYTGELERDLIGIVVAYQQTNRLRGAFLPALFAELARSDTLRGAFQSATANIRRISDIIVRYQAAGLLQREHPMSTLASLLGPLMVVEMFRRAEVSPTPPTIDPSAYVQKFLAGRAGGSQTA